jgi:hypothetical protein
MDFWETRSSLAKSLPRFFETELEPCDAVIEDEGDKSFQGLEAIRACGLFGGETLSLPLAAGSRDPNRKAPQNSRRRLACNMPRSSSRSDNAISTHQRAKL